MKPSAPYHKLGRAGLRRLGGAPDATRRLLCFPFLGGQSLSLRPLAAALPPDLEVLAVDPPGHGWATGTPLTSFDALLGTYLEELRPWLEGPPLALYGHSMGGLVAHRLAGALEREGRGPRRVLISSSPLPHRVLEYRYLRAMDDGALFGALDAVGSMGPAGLASAAAFTDLVMPAIRADLDALLGVRAADHPRLEAPLRVLYSQDDAFVPPGSMHEWRRYGAHVRFEVTTGDHQLVVSRANEVARWVAAALEETDDDPRR